MNAALNFLAVIVVVFFFVVFYEEGKLQKTEDHTKSCLTYHQELPYNKAIETCEVILKGKGDKK